MCTGFVQRFMKKLQCNFFCRKRNKTFFVSLILVRYDMETFLTHPTHTFTHTHTPHTVIMKYIVVKNCSKEYRHLATRHKSLSFTIIVQSRSAGEYLMNHVLRECRHCTRSTINYWSGFCPNIVVTESYLYHMPRNILRICHRNHHAVFRRQISGNSLSWIETTG